MRQAMHHFIAAVSAALILAAAPGCGRSGPVTAPSVGPGAGYRPPSLGDAAAHGEPVGGLACGRRRGSRFGVHIELFANRHVVIVPAGVGIAPPRKRAGAYVVSGRCYYPAITVEPTGVIQVAPGARLTLADLFAIWGQPLSRTRLAGFAAPAGTRVVTFVDGRLWERDPRAVPLTRHAQIVLELGGDVPPHRRYRFPPGL